MAKGQRKMKLPDQITLPCCACSGSVTFETPKKDSDRPTFYHTMPPCTKFNETNTAMGVVQYMRDCGDARGRN